MRGVHVSLTVILSVFAVACSGPSGMVSADPDRQFGHRYEGTPPDGYNTITISVPEEELEFTYFPATFDRVIVRPDMLKSEQDTVAVEILVKGSMPDACMELHAFDQKRTGNIITATLQMRRPGSRVCATVRRPYRLYLMLEGGFARGSYSLKLNDESVPFTVRQAEAG